MSDDTGSPAEEHADPERAAPSPEQGEGSQGSEGEEFDAIGAAAELDAALAETLPEPAGEPQGESYTDILESELSALNAMIADKDERLRVAGDELEKSSARIEREADKRFEQRTRTLLLEFIEVLDDLERALAAARELDHNPAVLQGMELVHKNFLARLGTFGVSHQPALGLRFDPERHDAISMIPSQDPGQDGVVVVVVREGYSIHEEVLRPAGVVVGKASS